MTQNYHIDNFRRKLIFGTDFNTQSLYDVIYNLSLSIYFSSEFINDLKQKIDMDIIHHNRLTKTTENELDIALEHLFWPCPHLTFNKKLAKEERIKLKEEQEKEEEQRKKAMQEAIEVENEAIRKEELAEQRRKRKQERRNQAKKKKEALDAAEKVGYLKLKPEEVPFKGTTMYNNGIQRKNWSLPCARNAKSLLIADSLFRVYAFSKTLRKGINQNSLSIFLLYINFVFTSDFAIVSFGGADFLRLEIRFL